MGASTVWYYAQDGVQIGPVSFDELKAAAAAGKVTPNDYVWNDGLPNWVVAHTVAGLFASPPPSPKLLPLEDAAAAGQRYDVRPRRQRQRPTGGLNTADVVAQVQEFVYRTITTNPGVITPMPTEVQQLTRAGVLDPTAQRFAAWRRGVLWVTVVPTAFAALLALITVIDTDRETKEVLSNFGMLMLYVQAFSLFALPVCSALAAVAYDRLSYSARLVLLGAAIAFGVPLLVAFVPADVWLDLKLNKSATVAQVDAVKSTFGILFGISLYLTLMPAVLSLLPAVTRGCVRVKTFLPESLVPGWGLVASIPLFVLLTLATFVLLYHMAGNTLLFLGLLLWVGAPLLYLTQFRLLTRPVSDRRKLAELSTTQLGVLGLFAGAVLLIIIYLFTATFMGRTIVGFEKTTSMIRPWSLELHAKWIEFLGRSLFLTVLFADVLVWIALSVWREERAFAGTPPAAAFDQTMTGLAEALAPGRPEPLP
jgi:hypothetical protein